MKQNTVKLNETQLKKIVAESVKRVLKEYEEPGSFCYSGDKKYDYLSNEIFNYVQDCAISEQFMENENIQKGFNKLMDALKTLEIGYREYNNYKHGGSYDGGEGFTDYSGGSLY
jgi:hypothetical protein